MMRYLLFCLLLIGAGFRPVLTELPNVQDEGLVAYYSFNQCDARDDTGGGSYGELHGNVKCWCGIEGEGLLLDGQSAYLTFQGPVNNYFGTSDLTVSFYVKPEAQSAFPLSLLGKRSACAEDNALDFLLDYTHKQVNVVFHETEFKYYPNLSCEPPATSWFHVAVVREGIRAFTYVNGQLVRESYRCSGVDISNEALLSFSDSPCVRQGRARRFRGIVDELRIYDRALTETEIGDLFARFPIENAVMDCVTFRDQDWGAGVSVGK